MQVCSCHDHSMCVGTAAPSPAAAHGLAPRAHIIHAQGLQAVRECPRHAAAQDMEDGQAQLLNGEGGHGHGEHGHEHGHGGEESINLKGAVIHVLGDLIQSLGVAAAGALIWWKQACFETALLRLFLWGGPSMRMQCLADAPGQQ